MTRDLQCLDQRGNARGIDIRNLGQVNRNYCRWLSMQQCDQAIAQIGGRINVDSSAHTDNRRVSAMVYCDLKDTACSSDRLLQSNPLLPLGHSAFHTSPTQDQKKNLLCGNGLADQGRQCGRASLALAESS